MNKHLATMIVPIHQIHIELLSVLTKKGYFVSHLPRFHSLSFEQYLLVPSRGE